MFLPARDEHGSHYGRHDPLDERKGVLFGTQDIDDRQDQCSVDEEPEKGQKVPSEYKPHQKQ